MKKLMMIAAVCAAAGAFAANVSGDPELYNISKVDNAYQATPVYSAATHNLSEAGWYAGLKLTWDDKKQIATSTKASVGDNATGTLVEEFTVCGRDNFLSPYKDQSPVGSGLENAFVEGRSGLTTVRYLTTTIWYFSVTPEMMYECFKAGKDYEITLTIGDNTYAVKVPKDGELEKDDVKWYPAVGLLSTKVYGDAQHLADQITLDNYQDVKFFADPSDLTFPDGFAAGDEVDGVWGVKMLHNHKWSFNVVDGTNLVATCGAANCPYSNGEVRMWLNVGTTEKDYDGVSVKRKAAFDEYFEDIFPDVSTVLTVNGVADGTVNTAGVYTVALSVTGVGGDSEPYVLSTTVTINKKDITGATLVLTPASPTYNAAEQTVTPSVIVDGLTATIEVADGSTTAATEIGEYAVTVNGTGNFTGAASATWEILNTTGAFSGVAATTSETAGNYEDGTLTVTDTMALAYEDGAWTAGLVLTWPMDKKDWQALSWTYHAYYVEEDSAKLTAENGVVENATDTSSYKTGAGSSQKKDFTYLATTTWTVPVTPAVVEAALAEEKSALEYAMRAGALVWGDSTEGDPDGVAFADYKIELSLENPIVLALGEGEVHDLGNTVLTTTRIKLAPGASVTSSVAQTAEDAIFIETPGYDVVCSESDGVYTYTTKFTHQHAWSFGVVDGTNLVATCVNGDCDMGGEVNMWLHVDATEKEYDGQSMTRDARYDDHFKSVFPGVSAKVSVNGEDGPINDAGTYSVVMNVTGLGDSETHVLSATVTVSPVDITGATLVLTPASTTYNAAEQTVTPSVTVGSLAATLEVAGGSTTAATEIGEYTVTVNGTGNFTGTASATWEIVNTTGEPTSVAASAAGSMTNVGNDFTLSDSSKLEYDSENKVWHAGITISWPMEKQDFLQIIVVLRQGSANYVKEDSARITTEDGVITNVLAESSYKTDSSTTKEFTYLSTTTWKVPLTPAIIEAAIAEEKTSLSYTMNAGAFVWGDSTEGDPDGVAFRDYTITIPLEGIKLYDENGHQVYPAQSEQDVVAEMKGAIDAAEGLDEGEKSAAKSKVDALVEAADGDAKAVRDWIGAKTGGDYAALAASDYIVASYALDTEDLITDASEVEVVGFETTDSGFAFAVKVDDGDVEASRIKAAGIVQSAASLEDGEFAPVDAERVVVDENKIIITKDPDFDCEFFKIVIKKDSAE